MAKQTNSEKYYGQGINVTTNAQKVLTNISNMIRGIKDSSENLSEWCARELANDARRNLKDSGYNVGGLLKNIEWGQNKNKRYYTVSIKDNSDKDTMYYLEYGTGFVGQDKPHKMAKEVGWKYAINEGADWYFDIDDPDTFSPKHNMGTTSYNRLGEDVGDKGWFYKDEHGRLNLTSGLKAVSYMFNSFDKFNDPNGAFERAWEKSKMKSIIKGR